MNGMNRAKKSRYAFSAMMDWSKYRPFLGSQEEEGLKTGCATM